MITLLDACRTFCCRQRKRQQLEKSDPILEISFGLLDRPNRFPLPLPIVLVPFDFSSLLLYAALSALVDTGEEEACIARM